jgi:aromatic ring-opening dioxygenase catalytic subunit (LigB family)
MTTAPAALPAYFIPHGGGPWPFVPEMIPAHGSLPAFLGGLLAGAGSRPRAIVVVSGHWEEPLPTVGSRSDYSMLYDYSGFPENTYELQYPAPGSPEVAARVVDALAAAGIAAATDSRRGYDHGVFVPLMLVAPDATIPVVPLSLVSGLDPAQHLAIGRALAPLRREGILIAGSGMSFHNLRALGGGAELLSRSQRFDAWLNDAVTGDPRLRDQRLADWAAAPEARFAHPREEHLLPLMVAAGAADGEPARHAFGEPIMGAMTSGFRFG